MKILVVGASARAVAQSVVSAGHEAVALDAFGDTDLLRIAAWMPRNKSVPLPSVALESGADAVLFASGVENNPSVISALERAGLRVLSAPEDAICGCRNTEKLTSCCKENGISYPGAHTTPPKERGAFLVKRFKSGAGIGIRNWLPGTELMAGEYFQERIEGIPLSAIFLMNGKEAVILGVSRQLNGEAALGAQEYIWCGNVMPFDSLLSRTQGEKLLAELRRIGTCMAATFGLCGACGLDFIFIHNETRLCLLEVNPRISASFELLERLGTNTSVLQLHLDALEGHLPPERAGILEGPYYGKGIVYAPGYGTAPDTGCWYGLGRRDIPHMDAALSAGSPICTVFTPGLPTGAEVMNKMGREARKIWGECGI